MRIAATLLALLVLPVLGTAQPALPVASTTGAANPTLDNNRQPLSQSGFMPLWGTPDGRILAMVALAAPSHGAPVLPQSPQIGNAADWQLIDVTNFVGGGLSLRFGDNVNSYANFGRGIVLEPLNPAALSFGCGAWQAMDPVGLCATGSRPLARSGRMRVGTDVSVGDFDIDLNYGLSWLNYATQRQPNAGAAQAWSPFASIGNSDLPTLIVPGIELGNMQNTGVSAFGRWRMDASDTLNLGAALGRIRFELPGNVVAPVINQAALSFGIRRGDFTGIIVGRVLGSSNPLSSGQHWSSLDLGISWQAPWRGIFSVGAQNLWSSGSPPLLINNPQPTVTSDPSQARVPYVQYHQDL